MSKKTAEIVKGIQQLAEFGKFSLEGDVRLAVVKSISNDNELEVEADELLIYNVLLRPIKNGTNQSVIIVPKVGSIVVIAPIDGGDGYYVIGVNEAEKVIADINGTTLEMSNAGIKLNGDQFGALIKVQELKTELAKVNAILNAIKTICTTPIPEPGNGSPSAFQAVLNAALSSLQTPTYTTIENQKVKHG